MAVSFTELVKPHLAVQRSDYSDARGFLLDAVKAGKRRERVHHGQGKKTGGDNQPRSHHWRFAHRETAKTLLAARLALLTGKMF